jgi:hypothetical protein
VDVSPATQSDGRQEFDLDPQEQAWQLILAKPNFADIAGGGVGLDLKMNVTSVLSVRGPRRADADGQESARRMLLGVGVLLQ